ncbi:Protein-disulfide isomerase [Candidatus Pantoea varia]|uniref:Protein-disulfide isomerase n=1 Tax=Candidatus Pantoea varia TaxID=1881036 RepID=A0A1I4Y696_9GAMM|nr:thioredoxin domain-containing protein [Pantoea varia]SFN33602.1 Protein-disulfide isomerase [Pantoea varia]
MRMKKLALAMMLLAGASGVSTAMAAEPAAADPAVNTVIQPDAAASAVLQPDPQPASSEAPAATATHEPSQQPDDSVATTSSNPASAEQQSVATAPAAGASSAPASQEAGASASVQVQPGSNQPSPAVNPPVEAASGAEKNEPQPAVINLHATQKPAQTPADKALFTPEQEARIGELAKAYLLQHPELLIEVDQKLQKIQYDEQMKAMSNAAIQHQDELLNDETVPAIGPEDATVAVIEFFDYQCSVCAHQAPIIQSLMKNNPQVRFIFKEWPIFGYRWKPSFQAAETGLRIWQQKGGDAYLKYHNALFARGHVEGALTQKDVTKAASAAGAGKLKNSDMLGTLSRTDILAKNTGFQGTPGIIVMPLSGAAAETVTIYPGGAMEEMLQAAINKASGSAGH